MIVQRLSFGGCQPSLPRKVPSLMRIPIVVASVVVASVALGACGAGGGDSPLSCGALDTGTADSALVIVTDGQSPAFSQVASLLATEDGARQLFGSSDLHLDEDSGMVVLAPFSPSGPIAVQSFNLAGVGNGGHAVADARTQRACLAQAINELPTAGGGDLLQALRASVPLAANRTAGPVAVLGFGASRLAIRDFSMAGSDLSTPEARDTAIEVLTSFGLVPEMSNRVAGVYFVAPDEGVDPLLAEGVRSFVGDSLCSALAAPCSSGVEPELAR